MQEFILYSYYRSSASYRARIALNLKGIAYEYRAVHLLSNGGEQKAESYRELNPSREVPSLVHNGRTVAQSMAIIEYLDLVRPEPRLFPSDPYQRALVVQACEIINSGIQPLHNLKVFDALAERFGADQEAKNAWARHWITEGLVALENLLKPYAARFCLGDAVTAADCFLVPQMTSGDRFEMDDSNIPTLTRVRANCEALKAFRDASPFNQPDTPPA